jgi:hypothetical protein
MKKNTFSTVKDKNLLAIIECLLKLIKKSHARTTFLNNSPQAILKAKLDALEFKSNGFNQNEYFIIKFKDKNKIADILFTKQLLAPIENNVADKKQFIEELKRVKLLYPKLTLRTVLKNVLAKISNKNIVIDIHETINFLQKIHLNNSLKKRNKAEINFLFNYLKINLLRIATAKKFHGCAESLLASAENLTQHCLLDLNVIIFSLNNLASLKNIAENNILYLKNIAKIIFSYKKLLHKVATVSPAYGESRIEIQNIIDMTIEDELANESIKADFIFFKQSYFSQLGFRSIFVDNDLYHLIQTACEKLNSFKKEYMQIINLIEGLSIYSGKMPEIIGLATKLSHFTNQYFQDLLVISISKTENKNHRQKEIFEDFQFRAQLAINDFREKITLSLSHMNILHKILNAIARLIPKFIISTKTRMSFFQKHTNQSKHLAKIESTFLSIKRCL